MNKRVAWISDRGPGYWHRTGDANALPAQTLCGKTIYAPEVRDERPKEGTFCPACKASEKKTDLGSD